MKNSDTLAQKSSMDRIIEENCSLLSTQCEKCPPNYMFPQESLVKG